MSFEELKNYKFVDKKPQSDLLEWNSVNKSVHNTIDDIHENPVVQTLVEYYNNNHLTFRRRQQEAFFSFIQNIKEWGQGDLIKLPTWTWKTFLFWHIIKALNLPSLVLVPRINLVSGTYKEFVGWGDKKWIWFEESSTYSIDGSDNSKGTISEQLEKIISQNSWKFSWTLILTYQSLMKVKDDSPELYNILKESVGFIVSDEAHRGLWKNTKTAINKLKSLWEVDDWETDFKSEIEIETDLESLKEVYHLHTTATRVLSNKSVDEKVTYSCTFGDVVKDGDLICPRQSYNIWAAYMQWLSHKKDNKNYNQVLDKYSDLNGDPIYQKITSEYKIEKEKNWEYLPTVAFCNTTKQVEQYVKYLLSQWIKAIQCTTNKKGINYKDIDQAELLLENWEADVIVTCSKVWEWWDLPTLRWAIWLCPSSSPARIIQWTWRITRVLKQEDIDRITWKTWIDEKYIRKGTDNTIIFSPSSWEVMKPDDTENQSIKESITDSKPEWNNWEIDPNKILYKTYTCLETFIEEGEITEEELKVLWVEYQLSEDKRLARERKEYHITYFSTLEITSYDSMVRNIDKLIHIEHDFSDIFQENEPGFNIKTVKWINNIIRLGKYLWFSMEDFKDQKIVALKSKWHNSKVAIKRWHWWNIDSCSLIIWKVFKWGAINSDELAFRLWFFEKIWNRTKYILDFNEELQLRGIETYSELTVRVWGISNEKCSNIIWEYFNFKSKKHIEKLAKELGMLEE